MTDDDLADRLDAVERRLDAAYPEPEDRVDPERVESLAERLADLEAAVEAVEGYVGHVERVDDDLERRANAALAAVDDLQPRVAALEGDASARPPDRTDSTDPAIDAGAEAGFGAPADAVADRGDDVVVDPGDDAAVPAVDAAEDVHDRSAPTDDRPARRDDPAASACVESQRARGPNGRTSGPRTAKPLEHRTDAAREARHDSTSQRSTPGDHGGDADRCPTCEAPRTAGSPAAPRPDAEGQPVSARDADASVANGTGADARNQTVDEATSPTVDEATNSTVDEPGDAAAWPPQDSQTSRRATTPDERTDPNQREPSRRDSTGDSGSRACDTGVRAGKTGSRASDAVEPWTERGPDAEPAELDAPARDDPPGETLYERLRAML